MDHGITVVSLYYDPSTDTVIHEDGRILDDISNLISRTEFEKLKRVGGTQYIVSDEDDVTYELVVPIYDSDIITFYYDNNLNVMIDCNSDVMVNIFSYIRPRELDLFKERKENMIFYGRNGHTIELIYPEID